MDVKDLNKSQLILLVILLSFITSIATGITTVTLLEKAPQSVTVPINRIVRETVEKIVPDESSKNFEALSKDQKKLLEELKAIKPLTVTLYLQGNADKKTEDKILGTGLFLGNDKVVIASNIPEQKEGEVYVVRSVLGEQKVSKITHEKDFTIVEFSQTEVPPKAEESIEEKIEEPTTPPAEASAVQ